MQGRHYHSKTTRACNGPKVRAGPGRSEKIHGPGRAGSRIFENMMGRAGSGRGPSTQTLMGRAGPRPMRCALYMGRSAEPLRWPTSFHRPTRAAVYEMWCTLAAIICTMTKSTLPMRFIQWQRCSGDGVATTAPSCVLRQSTALCSMPEINDDGVYVLNIATVPKRKQREHGERWV